MLHSKCSKVWPDAAKVFKGQPRMTAGWRPWEPSLAEPVHVDDGRRQVALGHQAADRLRRRGLAGPHPARESDRLQHNANPTTRDCKDRPATRFSGGPRGPVSRTYGAP